MCAAVNTLDVSADNLYSDYIAPNEQLLELYNQVIGTPEKGLSNSHEFRGILNTQKKQMIAAFLLTLHGDCGTKDGGVEAVCKF